MVNETIKTPVCITIRAGPGGNVNSSAHNFFPRENPDKATKTYKKTTPLWKYGGKEKHPKTTLHQLLLHTTDVG